MDIFYDIKNVLTVLLLSIFSILNEKNRNDPKRLNGTVHSCY